MKKVTTSIKSNPSNKSQSSTVGNNNNIVINGLVRTSMDSTLSRIEEGPIGFPFKLSLYSSPPNFDVTIDEFEEWGLARLSILRAIDAAMVRGLREEELRVLVKSLEQHHGMTMHSNSVSRQFALEMERKKDLASHYILQLVFAGTTEGRRWFIQQESTLLKCRYMNEVGQEKMQWLHSEISAYKKLDDKKKIEMQDLLMTASPQIPFHNEDFYEIPFHHVPELFGRRMVYLEKGMTYVGFTDTFSAVLYRFKKQLEELLMKTAEMLPNLKDNRITGLLEALRLADTFEDTETNGDKQGSLSATEVDKMVIHFPPCMQQLHSKLRSSNHLKYGGRQQYGTFLKSLSMSLEDALTFWRKSFIPKIDEASFAKNYAYNVRHLYGQEGKRVPAPHQTCMKVIGSTVGVDDAHGCPFKHLKEEKLSRLLNEYTAPNQIKLSEEYINELIEMVRGKHYQLACTKLFELTRQSKKMDTITHPHLFFQKSIEMDHDYNKEEEELF